MSLWGKRHARIVIFLAGFSGAGRPERGGGDWGVCVCVCMGGGGGLGVGGGGHKDLVLWQPG